MITKMNWIGFALFLLISLTTACGVDDPYLPDEEEVITSLKYTLTPVNGGTAVILSFQDLDGDGGNAPIITSGALTANTIYNASLELLNETVTPVQNITEEILKEGDAHQFFFQFSSNNLQINYADTDVNGQPIGLTTTVATGAAGSGTLTITLRHEPSKTASGVSSGDLTNAGGETDIEVSFGIDVQ